MSNPKEEDRDLEDAAFTTYLQKLSKFTVNLRNILTPWFPKPRLTKLLSIYDTD